MSGRILVVGLAAVAFPFVLRLISEVEDRLANKSGKAQTENSEKSDEPVLKLRVG